MKVVDAIMESFSLAVPGDDRVSSRYVQQAAADDEPVWKTISVLITLAASGHGCSGSQLRGHIVTVITY